jgi:hypothetical protein
MSIPTATAATAGSLDRNRVALPCPAKVSRATTDARRLVTVATAGVTRRNRRATLACGVIQAITARQVQIAVNTFNRGPSLIERDKPAW